MQKALEYFAKMGLPIKNGLIDSSALTEEQMTLLKQWENETEINGIMMPELEDFYKTLLLAISTHPQKTEDGQINYLLGKGIGVEIALRGKIPTRTQYDTSPIYRSHSDFELYDTKENPYSVVFQEIFGSQEYYPETKTKGLRNIPEGYMDNTYETVILEGYEILVPQLEILFLDKFLRKESTPREGIYDCELLADRYELNVELIKQYLEEYYFRYENQMKLDVEERYKKNFARILTRNLNQELYDNQDIKSVVNQWNARIREISETNKSVIVSGIRPEMYIPITQDDVYINENGEIALEEEYTLKTMELIPNVTKQQIKETRIDTLVKLDELFARVAERRAEKSKTEDCLNIKDYEDLAYDEQTVTTLEGAVNEIKNHIREKDSMKKETKEKEGQTLGDD